MRPGEPTWWSTLDAREKVFMLAAYLALASFAGMVLAYLAVIARWGSP